MKADGSGFDFDFPPRPPKEPGAKTKAKPSLLKKRATKVEEDREPASADKPGEDAPDFTVTARKPSARRKTK
jgi:hypothetical protein